ncbi:hypothetical protein AB3N60_10650 [Leptospira sp. WS39.C2]
MNQTKRSKNVFLIFIFFILAFHFHCRVNPNPKGSLFDPQSAQGALSSFFFNDILNNVSSRGWTVFSPSFGTTDPSDSVLFDQEGTTTYAIYVRNTNLTTRLYSSTNGMNYSQLGLQINNTNTNIFGAFTGRSQLSNYHSLNLGGAWTANALITGFCMVRYNTASAYILGDGIVDRTIDSGNSINTISTSPAYSSRNSGVCSFGNGKIYLVGGKNASSNLFDLWESTDGINWSLLTQSIIPTQSVGFNRPCYNIQNSNETNVLGMVYSDITSYKFHVVLSNLALLQSNDGKNWSCTNPNITYKSEFNTIANRVVLVGKRLFVYGQSNTGVENVYTDLE